MYRTLLSFCLFALSLTALNAQTDVTLNINHKLGDAAFAMGTPAVNDIGSTFQFNRFEYYIAEISILHDDGQETTIDDLYMLVSADETTSQALGNLAITNVEAIRFHIGVDEARNHNDPASYASDHPLAPKFPSMHWGWASGYRFGAFEGRSGSALDQIWEIHALEDENYFQTEVPLDLTVTNGALTIELDADYVRAFEGIDLDSGPVTHGGFGAAKTSLENFRDFVFSPTALVNSTEELLTISEFRVYPNPATTKNASIYLATDQPEVFQVQITNAAGQIVRQLNQVPGNTAIELELENAGMYFISARQEGNAVTTKTLIIQ